MFYISYFSNIYPSKKKRKFCNINLNHKGLLSFFFSLFNHWIYLCDVNKRDNLALLQYCIFSCNGAENPACIWVMIKYTLLLHKKGIFFSLCFLFLLDLSHFLSGVDWRRFFQTLVIHSFVRFLVNHLLHSWQINLICLYKAHLEEFALVLFIEIVGGIFSKHSLFFPGWWIGWIIHVSISSFLDKMWNGEVPDTSASSSFYNSRT